MLDLAEGRLTSLAFHHCDWLKNETGVQLHAHVVEEPVALDSMVRRAIHKLRSPSNRGLRLMSRDSGEPAFDWNLEPSYWNDFSELVLPLMQAPSEGGHCYLPSEYHDDAEVIVEVRSDSHELR